MCFSNHLKLLFLFWLVGLTLYEVSALRGAMVYLGFDDLLMLEGDRGFKNVFRAPSTKPILLNSLTRRPISPEV